MNNIFQKNPIVNKTRFNGDSDKKFIDCLPVSSDATELGKRCIPNTQSSLKEGGLRKNSDFNSLLSSKPLISILTVVFNGERFIESSILSVINQSYDNIEYIIIDGGSTDETLNIIRKYENFIDYWVSERDGGIYDAMNKGISSVSPGAWVLIIGADDKLLDISHLLSAVSTYKNARNFLFDVVREDEKSNEKRRHFCHIPNFDKDFLSFPLHHQAFVFKKDDNLKFDLKLGIHADLHFMYSRIHKGGVTKINEAISSYRTGGASSRLYLNNARSIYSVAKKLRSEIYPDVIKNNFSKFILLFIKAFILSLTKRFFSQ